MVDDNEDSGNLTADEYAEYKSLRSELGDVEEPRFTPPTPVRSQEPVPEGMEQKTEVIGGEEFQVVQEKNSITRTQAMVTSLMEGSIGKHAGEVVGAVHAGLDMIEEDHSWSDWSALYHKNKDIYDTIRKEGESAYPISTFAAEAVGGIGFAALLGGAGVAVNTVKGAAVAGGIAGFGAGDVRDENLISSTVGGAALAGFSQKLLNKFLPSAATKAAGAKKAVEDKVLDVEQAGAILESMGINAKLNGRQITPVAKKMYQSLDKRGVEPIDWANSIKKDANGNFNFQPGDTFLDVKNRMIKQKKDWGAGINEVVLEADTKALNVGIDGVIDGGEFFAKIEIMKDTLTARGATPGQLNLIDRVLKPHINKTKLTFSNAQEMNRNISHVMDDMIKSSPAFETVAWDIKSVIKDQIIEKMTLFGDDVASAYKLANSKYGDFALAEQILTEPAKASSLGIISNIQNVIMSTSKRFFRSAVYGSKRGMIGNVVDGIRAAAAGQAGMAGLTGKRLLSAQKIANALEQNPGKFQDIASQLFSAASREPEYFAHMLGYAESVIDLSETPIQRNMQDITMKLPQALNILREKSPGTYQDLLRNMQANNQAGVGEIISNLGRTAEGAKFIAPGLGFDGRVATDADYKQVKSQIVASPQNNIMKARQLMELDKSGTIPQMENPREFMKQTIAARRKNGKKVSDF